MKRLFIALASSALLLTAVSCGSDESSSWGSTGSTTASEASSVDTVDAGAFPVTIPTKFGDITVDAEPQRVVSLGFSDQDFLLALGVTPIAIRDWYGDQPFGTWPWAQDEFGDAEPTVLLSSGISTSRRLRRCSPTSSSPSRRVSPIATTRPSRKMAPTFAQPGDYIDYGTPWDVTTEVIGKAVGKSAEATAIVEHVERAVRHGPRDHPEFEGATAAVAFYFDECPARTPPQTAAAASSPISASRSRPKFDELAGDQFYFSVSGEELRVLDTDVLVWIVGDAAGVATVRDIPLRPTLRAFEEGRE